MIRKATILDAKAIRDIAADELGYSESLELVEAQLRKMLNNKAFFLYVFDDGEVLGFVEAHIYESSYAPTGINVTGLAVKSKHHGKGIGKSLLGIIEEDARRLGYKYVKLNSGSHRLEAHKFYEKMGYDGWKTQKRFIKDI